jgi:tetratricopeptide (TPR) repeat protein
VLANCLIERAEHSAARRHPAAAEKLPYQYAPTRSAVLLTRARLALVEGDLEKALADYSGCGELGKAAGAQNPAMLPWRSGAAIACSLLGRMEDAVDLAEGELSLAEGFGAPGAIGRALRALGTVRGPERGIEALEAAVERTEASQAALERARALVEFGAALRRSGRRRDAREPLRHGLDLAQRCGAEALVARAKDEAKIAGAKPRRTAVSGVDSLTERERQVARLAAQGMSNRQIMRSSSRSRPSSGISARASASWAWIPARSCASWWAAEAAPGSRSAGDHGSCLQLPEGGLQGAASAVVEPVHRALRLTDPARDLARREARDVTEHEHLALVLGEPVEGLTKRLRTVEPDLLVTLVGRPDLLERDLPPRAHMVQRHVPGHAQDPRLEGNLARLVLMDRRDQLREHVLSDVLGLMGIADDAPHEAANIIGIAHVEK